MEEKNELNDIILNKGGGSGGGKKVLMAVATLAIILIIVVVIMNRLNSDGTDNLPQAVLPPEPDAAGIVKEDPLFEPVEVIKEDVPEEDNLDRIAQKLKEESMVEEAPVVVVEEVPEVVEPAPVATKPAPKPAPAAPKPAAVTPKGQYYVQVGSFSKLEPNAKFLQTITESGYQYHYHTVRSNGRSINKVLVGPFGSEREARKALPSIRKNIEPGAFLTKV